MKTIELDTKILNKNLEITRITTDHDNLLSNHVELQSHHDKLSSQLKTKDDLLTMSELSKKELTKQVNDLKETRERRSMSKSKNDKELHFLLTEVHERMYPMMEYCERLTPVKLDIGKDKVSPITVDITDEEEMMITKLFRLVELPEEMTSYDDQTSRSILKDLRKVIKSLEE